MLAYVFEGGKKFALKEMPRPLPKKDTFTIKVKACSICGTDFRAFLHGNTKIVPGTIVGHEVCGEVVEKGENVNIVNIGDRITIAPAIGCGICYSCRQGHPNMCDNLQTIGFQYDGGFAEYMEVPSQAVIMNNVNQVPDNISDEEAALTEPIACVINAQEYLKIGKGDFVAIFGSGFIGCMHAELALASGADKVIMMEISKVRADEAKQQVPQIVMIDPSSQDVYKEVDRLTNGRGVDVAIVACSVGKAQTDALMIAGKRARISLFGGIPGDATGFLDSNIIHYRELSIHGVHASTPAQNRKVLTMIASGEINVKKYITRIYPLDEITNAFLAIQNESIMKAVIKPAR
ncbi:MAG: zinc-dependent dehydrogenase [Eubacteriales bacterium]